MRTLAPLIRPLTSPHTHRRWVYLIIGGALLTPYAMAAVVITSVVTGDDSSTGTTPHAVAAAIALTLAPVAATAHIPGVRTAQLHLAHTLLRGPLTTGPPPHPTTARATARTSLWLCLHMILGFLICMATMVGLTEAFLLAIAPLIPDGPQPATRDSLLLGSIHDLPRHQRLIGPLLGLALLTALTYTVALTGHLLSRLAPHLLGPSPAERLAAAHAHADNLAERNRLARELHDTLGHALSVVTVQAATAARLIDTDPDFARQALTHIADAARTATADLDHALGVLREDTPTPRAPPPDLTRLSHLATATRHTGTDLTYTLTGDPARVPALLSRETYRIAQEALTNALRHAPHQPIALTLDLTPTDLTLTLTNPLPTTTRARRRTGGRGITGMRERAHLLGGTLTAGPTTTHWNLTLHLTWKAHP